jgi:hypothetical protein
MSQELKLGKYEFYPYEFDADKTPTLDELKEFLRKASSKKEKDVETPLPNRKRRRPRRKRRG